MSTFISCNYGHRLTPGADTLSGRKCEACGKSQSFSVGFGDDFCESCEAVSEKAKQWQFQLKYMYEYICKNPPQNCVGTCCPSKGTDCGSKSPKPEPSSTNSTDIQKKTNSSDVIYGEDGRIINFNSKPVAMQAGKVISTTSIIIIVLTITGVLILSFIAWKIK